MNKTTFVLAMIFIGIAAAFAIILLFLRDQPQVHESEVNDPNLTVYHVKIDGYTDQICVVYKPTGSMSCNW